MYALLSVFGCVPVLPSYPFSLVLATGLPQSDKEKEMGENGNGKKKKDKNGEETGKKRTA